VNSQNLLDIAALGTTKHRAAQEPADLLIHIAEKSIQQTAGFVVPRTPINPPRAQNNRLMCSESAMHYLSHILRNTYEWSRIEWFSTMALAELRVHDAYLPQVIRMGTNNNHLRPAIAALLDERAFWLVKQIEEHADHWINNVQPINFADRLQQQRQQELNLQKRLYEQPLFELVSDIPRYELPWGESFANRLLDVLLTNHVKHMLDQVDLYYVLRIAAYHFPISNADRLLDAIHRIVAAFYERFSQTSDKHSMRKRIVETFQSVIEDTQHILVFRRKMVSAIENGAS
jgi:hypothetical protein